MTGLAPSAENPEIAAVYAALDAKREALGLSWREVTNQINSLFARSGARPMSQSTITGLRRAAVAEADGVLQILRWLDRSPEEFVAATDAAVKLPSVASDRILRFDTGSLYAALDAQRLQRRLSWAQVAAEIGGVGGASLSRLSRGGRTAFPLVVRIARWLNRPSASFTKPFPR